MHILFPKRDMSIMGVYKEFKGIYRKGLLLRLNLADSVDQQVASNVIPAESFLSVLCTRGRTSICN